MNNSIHYVIKGTKTIEEYKKVYSAMQDEAKEHYETHKKACERWTHREPAKVWIDGDGHMCIEYEDGMYWHYNSMGEWW